MKVRTRKTNNKRPISWYLTWIIIDAIAMAIIAGFIFSLPVWQVRQVEVTGNKYISNEKIIDTAAIPLGNNIFMIDADEVKSNFAKIVQISEIKIRRKLPASIIIEVKERSPFAIVMIGSQTTLIDDEGYIIAKHGLGSSVYRMEIAGLPVIRGISAGSLRDGQRLSSSDRIFITDTINLLYRFIDPRTVQIDVGNREDINIFMEDIIKVKIGDTKDIERKIRTLRALLGSAKNKWTKIAYIDIRVPDDPVIRFK